MSRKAQQVEEFIGHCEYGEKPYFLQTQGAVVVGSLGVKPQVNRDCAWPGLTQVEQKHQFAPSLNAPTMETALFGRKQDSVA